MTADAKRSGRAVVMLEFYRSLPKVELHAHLNGSLSENTVRELMMKKLTHDDNHLSDLTNGKLVSGLDRIGYRVIYKFCQCSGRSLLCTSRRPTGSCNLHHRPSKSYACYLDIFSAEYIFNTGQWQ